VSEAALPTQQPQAGETPWLSASHVDSGRAGHLGGAPSEGPAEIVGLTPTAGPGGHSRPSVTRGTCRDRAYQRQGHLPGASPAPAPGSARPDQRVVVGRREPASSSRLCNRAGNRRGRGAQSTTAPAPGHTERTRADPGPRRIPDRGGISGGWPVLRRFEGSRGRGHEPTGCLRRSSRERSSREVARCDLTGSWLHP